MKKSKLVIALSAFPIVAMSMFSCTSPLNGAYVFMHKQSGNAYGISVYRGVSTYLKSIGIKCADRSPSEQAVSNQVQMIENAEMLGAKAVIVSSSGEVGYDNVLKRVTEKGMKIVSVDSPISPKYRSMHVDQCDPQAIGSFIARSSVCIAIAQRMKEKKPESDYAKYAEFPSVPNKPDEYSVEKLVALTQSAINEYKNLDAQSKIHIAIITSTAASPSQNEWIAAIKEELNGKVEYDDQGNKINYNDVVDINYTNNNIKLGLDESVESSIKAKALIESEDCDVIANVTSVACRACGEMLGKKYNEAEKYKRVKMTGLGMPSEMWEYMPNGDDANVNALDYPCPYACLWNVPDMGYVAAQVAEQAVNNPNYNPSETYTYKLMNGDSTSPEPVENKDGSLKLQPLDPLPLYRSNILKWKPQF